MTADMLLISLAQVSLICGRITPFAPSWHRYRSKVCFLVLEAGSPVLNISMEEWRGISAIWRRTYERSVSGMKTTIISVRRFRDEGSHRVHQEDGVVRSGQDVVGILVAREVEVKRVGHTFLQTDGLKKNRKPGADSRRL